MKNYSTVSISLSKDKLIEDYSLKHLIDLAASTPGPIDRSHIMQCYNEVLAWACHEAYFTVTESMIDIIESTRTART
jgi:hypothetical protein